MTARSLLARGAAVTAVLPLAGGLLLAAAPAASAAVTAPGNGTVFTDYSSFRISASYGPSGSAHQLTLTSPGGAAVTIARAEANRVNGGTMTYDMDTGCWTVGCSGTNLAPNGTWTITQSGGTSASSTFITRISPRPPTAVSAAPLSPREVRVSWRAGEEPDLTGWRILEGADVVVDGIGRGACEGAACSAVVTYPAEGSGEHSYTVQALRSAGPGESEALASSSSEPASARLDAPPASPPPGDPAAGGGDPADGGSTGGSTGGGTGGSGGTGGGAPAGGSTGGSGGGTTGGGTGGSAGGGSTTGGSRGTAAPIGTGTKGSGATADQTAVAQRKAFALGFSTFGPKLGIPKLPPLPQSQAPAIAPELEDGSFGGTLGFQDQVLTERVPVAQGPADRVRNVVGSALDSERLVRSTAGALVLLLAGAHLRRWLGAAAADDL